MRKFATHLFAVIAGLSALFSIFFLIFNSRPSADEYLVAPILYGFYVDAPDRKLFEASSNFLIDYLYGIHAIVSLGWDSYGNAGTFQMIPAVLTNYFGPISSTVLGLVVHAIIILVALGIATQILESTSDRLMFTSVFIIGLFVAVILGDYQTARPFGIFPLTGIRFSSYLIQPLILLLLVFFLTKEIVVGLVNRKKLVLVFILFPMFVSLWTTMYLLLLVPIVFAISEFAKKNRRGTIKYWFKVYGAVFLIGILNASFVVFPRIDAGRSTLANSSFFVTLKDFVQAFLLSSDSRVYSMEVWRTILFTHSAVGLLSGLVVSLVLGKRLNLTGTFYVFIASLLIFVLALPLVFTFQEFITYQAFWHRTTPIVFSFVLSFCLGLLVGQVVRSRLASPYMIPMMFLLVVLSFLTYPKLKESRDKVFSSAQILVTFRVNWDAGDPFGVGTSIENLAPYSILNFMQLKPYKHPFWNPPQETLNEVNLNIESANSEFPSFKGDVLKLKSDSTYFTEELGGKVSFQFEVVDPSININGERSISNATPVNSDTVLQIVPTLQGLMISGETRLNQITTLDFDGNCEKISPDLPISCYAITGLKPGFSKEFREKWGFE